MAEKTGEKKEVSSKKKIEDLTLKCRENPWIVSTAVFGVLILILLIFGIGSSTGNVISADDAGRKLADFAKFRGMNDASVDKVVEKNGFYEVTLSIQGDRVPVFVTRDGENIAQLIPLSSNLADNIPADNIPDETRETPTEILRSDKPKVELFVMTHCPYGMQAEKGIIPAIEALGNKIDGKIRFVHYFMHGDEEEQETYAQLCIREEQQEKYLAYLECFLGTGESDSCLSKSGIDKPKLNSCLAEKAKDYYAADSQLSESYGVRGSPTLIINGVQADSERDSASLLKTICSAFNSKPAECNSVLSSTALSPGFGYSTTASSSTATCG